MTASNFSRSLSLVLQSEGGNDDDLADHGGRTSRGITQREYDAWIREQGRPTADVWTATDDEIATIYRAEYWAPFCDAMPTGIDYLYFDMAVNAGPYRAAVMLQRALGVTDDGRIGPITREAVQKADAVKLIADYSDAKRGFYRSLHQPRFLNGWLNRTAIVQKNATAMLISEAA